MIAALSSVSHAGIAAPVAQIGQPAVFAASARPPIERVQAGGVLASATEDWRLERRRRALIAREQATEGRLEREQSDQRLRAQAELAAQHQQAEESRRLAALRQKDDADRQAEIAWVAEAGRLADAAAQMRQREEERLKQVEATEREERRLAEVRQKADAARAQDAEKTRLADEAARRKREDDEKRAIAQRAAEDKRIAEEKQREERRLAELRQKEEAAQAARVAEAEKQRVAEAEKVRIAEEAARRKREDDEKRAVAQRAAEDKRIAEEKQREERRLAELRQKEEAAQAARLAEAEKQRAAEAEKVRIAEAAAQSRRDDEQRRIAQQAAAAKPQQPGQPQPGQSQPGQSYEIAALQQQREEEARRAVTAAPAPAGPGPSAPTGETASQQIFSPGSATPPTPGFSGLVADEVSAFTNDQRRLARTRIERESRARSGLLDEGDAAPDAPADASAARTQTQIAALQDPPATPPAAPKGNELSSRDDIKALQTELKRLGCYNGSTNGRLTTDTTIGLKTAQRYLGSDGVRLDPATAEALELLKGRKPQLCTGKIGCGDSQSKDGTTCIASLPLQQPPAAAPRVRPRAAEEEERPRPRQRIISSPAPQAAPARQQPAPRAAPGPAAPAGRPSINLSM